jgi:hypothetical protein
MYHDKNGWIPISKSLPEEGDECFVFFKNWHGADTWCFTIYFNEKFDSVENVSHWRPSFDDPVKEKED